MLSTTSTTPPLARRHIRLLIAAALAAALGSTLKAAGVSTPNAAEGAMCERCADVPRTACSTLPRPQDQLWLVSDRSLGCADVDAQSKNLQYWHFQPGRGWQAANSTEFFAGDDAAAITQVWIHGNRISHSDAFRVGWTAYASIARQTTDERPLRFVIWSWPSERIQGGQIEDIRVKAGRTGASSLHLARFLDTIASDDQITICGYSFGARIATGALHLMAGGTINGRVLAMHTASRRPRFAVVLMAAALDCDWILPAHCHGRASQMIDRLLLVNNGCDRVLGHYHWLYGRRSCAEALGYTGLAYGRLGTAQVTQFDACCYVGPQHDWSHYFGSNAVVSRILPYVFQSAPIGAGQPATQK